MPRESFAVVMAGGSGTRFWPLSRKAWPKQFLSLDNGDESLLQAAVRRLAAVIRPENIYIVTSHRHAAVTAEQLPDLPAENILAEPAGRNTAPCVGWAATHIRRRCPDGLVAVFPADPRIDDEAAYCRTVRRALQAADTGSVVTIGITPTRPETGYGYVEVGDALPGETIPAPAPESENTSHKPADGRAPYARTIRSISVPPGGLDPAGTPDIDDIPVNRVLRFVEKPDLTTAESYLAAGNFLWNSGMFFFRVDVILDAITRFLPELDAGLQNLDEAARAGTEAEVAANVYPHLPSISIDYGVMEKCDDILVVPGSFGWSDIGSWTVAWEHAEKDSRGNARLSEAVVIDAENCYLRGHDPKKLIALVGVHDLVVVDTPDALLIVPRDRDQEVRRVIEQLRARSMGDEEDPRL